MRHSKNVGIPVLALLLATTTLLAVFGQAFSPFRDAGAKVRFDYAHRPASRNLRNSRAVTRDFQTYARNAQRANVPVAPAVARAHAEELDQSIKQAQKHLAEERKIAENEKEVLAHLDRVDKAVAEEAKHQVALMEACRGDKLDVAACLRCCEDAQNAVEKAIDHHDELLAKVEDSSRK